MRCFASQPSCDARPILHDGSQQALAPRSARDYRVCLARRGGGGRAPCLGHVAELALDLSALVLGVREDEDCREVEERVERVADDVCLLGNVTERHDNEGVCGYADALCAVLLQERMKAVSGRPRRRRRGPALRNSMRGVGADLGHACTHIHLGESFAFENLEMDLLALQHDRGAAPAGKFDVVLACDPDKEGKHTGCAGPCWTTRRQNL